MYTRLKVERERERERERENMHLVGLPLDGIKVYYIGGSMIKIP